MTSTRVYRISTALLVVTAVGLAGCGGGDDGPSPGEVARQWRTAERNGDFATSWDLEAPEWRGKQDKAASVAADEQIEKEQPPPLPGSELVDVEVIRTVKDDTRKEDYVFVYLRLTEKDGDTDDQTVTLRRVDGAWRVAQWEP